MNLATAFDCPFDGAVTRAATMDMLEKIVPIVPDAEIALCDTTGRVTPHHVTALFSEAVARYPDTRWAFHGHDTYGMGIANAIAAIHTGVGVIDSSIGGLGGCPFAPGATGNLATEDVVWAFDRMNISTGIDLEMLLPVSQSAAALPGALPGGRVRAARQAKCA